MSGETIKGDTMNSIQITLQEIIKIYHNNNIDAEIHDKIESMKENVKKTQEITNRI